MCAEEFKSIVDTSFDAGITPIWLYTQDYIYGLVAANQNGDRWIEVSYTFKEEEPLVKTERMADQSYQFLLEEIEKGVSFYIDDLKVPLIKDFSKTLESKSGPDKIKAIIAELINNSSNYSSKFPIIKSKEELSILKERI
jgi:hypothetical protein